MRFVIIFKLFFERLASVKTFTIPLDGQKDNMNGQTILDICRTTGQKPDTIRKRFDRAYKESGRTYSQAYCPTPEEMEILFPEKRNGKKNMEKSVSEEKIVKLSIQSPVVSNEVPPGKKKSEPAKTDWFVFWPSLFITALSIALTITGLFVFAQWAGAFLGGMFALFLFIAVMVARDRMKGDTSKAALLGVLRLELGAAGLHCFTFWRLLPEFPTGVWFFAARIALCISLAGFAAYLSYSAVLTVRNYNAET